MVNSQSGQGLPLPEIFRRGRISPCPKYSLGSGFPLPEVYVLPCMVNYEIGLASVYLNMKLKWVYWINSHGILQRNPIRLWDYFGILKCFIL